MSTEAVSQALTPIIAGPLLRKLDSDSLHLWLATSCDSAIDVTIFENEAALSQKADIQTVHLGRKLYLKFIKVDFEKPLPADTPLAYALNLDGAPIAQILEHDLNYAAESFGALKLTRFCMVPVVKHTMAIIFRMRVVKRVMA